MIKLTFKLTFCLYNRYDMVSKFLPDTVKHRTISFERSEFFESRSFLQLLNHQHFQAKMKGFFYTWKNLNNESYKAVKSLMATF